jgi:CheY-like chemotaxis protein
MGELGRWLGKFQDVTLAFAFFVGAFGVGFVAVLSHQRGAAAVLWALACVVAGAVIGFLFGIPRVLQRDVAADTGTAASPAGRAARAASAVPYRMQVNTNLEQISDWLTKIIVGIGLVEFKQIPGLLDRAATFVARGLGAETQTGFAAAVIVYFAVVGFLGGYVLTRIYLTGAFRRADEGAVTDVAGTELTIEEVNLQIRTAVSDLRTQILQLQSERTAPAAGASERLSVTRPIVKSILWVDDYPKNNSLIIEYLKGMDIDVVTVQTTSEALAALDRRVFDRVITDMGRHADEGGPRAGIELIRRIRGGDRPYSRVPIVVYCSAPAAQNLGPEAVAAGAALATPSQSELIEALHLFQ